MTHHVRQRRARLMIVIAAAAVVTAVTALAGPGGTTGKNGFGGRSAVSPGGPPVYPGGSGGGWTARTLSRDDDSLLSVSCGAPGSCTAGGTFADMPGTDGQAILVSEVDGTWLQATQIPGLAAPAKAAYAQSDDHDVNDLDTALATVSCSSPGSCAATGSYGQDSALDFLAR